MSATASAYRVTAFNYAFDSDNKIHSDDVASQFGFRGGLVPGVADYAYLARGVFGLWGEGWLAGGNLQGKFLKPVYDGETVEVVVAGDPASGSVELELRNPAGEACAVGTAERHVGDPAPSAADYPRIAPDAARRPPTVADLPEGTELSAYEYAYEAGAAAAEAARLFVEPFPAAADGATIWHPALCLHDANRILRENVDLGPWIHTGSRVHYLAGPRDGETISLRGRVIRTYDKRGHVMTELDLAQFAVDAAGETRALARIHHTAIIAVRQPA